MRDEEARVSSVFQYAAYPLIWSAMTLHLSATVSPLRIQSDKKGPIITSSSCENRRHLKTEIFPLRSPSRIRELVWLAEVYPNTSSMLVKPAFTSGATGSSLSTVPPIAFGFVEFPRSPSGVSTCFRRFHNFQVHTCRQF